QGRTNEAYDAAITLFGSYRNGRIWVVGAKLDEHKFKSVQEVLPEFRNAFPADKYTELRDIFEGKKEKLGSEKQKSENKPVDDGLQITPATQHDLGTLLRKIKAGEFSSNVNALRKMDWTAHSYGCNVWNIFARVLGDYESYAVRPIDGAYEINSTQFGIPGPGRYYSSQGRLLWFYQNGNLGTGALQILDATEDNALMSDAALRGVFSITLRKTGEEQGYQWFSCGFRGRWVRPMLVTYSTYEAIFEHDGQLKKLPSIWDFREAVINNDFSKAQPANVQVYKFKMTQNGEERLAVMLIDNETGEGETEILKIEQHPQYEELKQGRDNLLNEFRKSQSHSAYLRNLAQLESVARQLLNYDINYTNMLVGNKDLVNKHPGLMFRVNTQSQSFFEVIEPGVIRAAAEVDRNNRYGARIVRDIKVNLSDPEQRVAFLRAQASGDFSGLETEDTGARVLINRENKLVLVLRYDRATKAKLIEGTVLRLRNGLRFDSLFVGDVMSRIVFRRDNKTADVITGERDNKNFNAGNGRNPEIVRQMTEEQIINWFNAGARPENAASYGTDTGIRRMYSFDHTPKDKKSEGRYEFEQILVKYELGANGHLGKAIEALHEFSSTKPKDLEPGSWFFGRILRDKAYTFQFNQGKFYIVNFRGATGEEYEFSIEQNDWQAYIEAMRSGEFPEGRKTGATAERGKLSDGRNFILMHNGKSHLFEVLSSERDELYIFKGRADFSGAWEDDEPIILSGDKGVYYYKNMEVLKKALKEGNLGEPVLPNVTIEKGELKNGLKYVLLTGTGEHKDDHLFEAYDPNVSRDKLKNIFKPVVLRGIWEDKDGSIVVSGLAGTYYYKDIQELRAALKSGDLGKPAFNGEVTSEVYKIGDQIFVYLSGTGDHKDDHMLKVIDARKENPENIFEPVIGQVAWEDKDSSIVLNLNGALYIFSNTKEVTDALKAGKLPDPAKGSTVNSEVYEINNQTFVYLSGKDAHKDDHMLKVIDARKENPKNIFEPVIGQVAWEDKDSDIILTVGDKLYTFKSTKEVKNALETKKLPKPVIDGTKIETKDVKYNGKDAVLVTIYLGTEKETIYEIFIAGERSDSNIFKGKVSVRLYPEKRVVNNVLISGLEVAETGLKLKGLPEQLRAKIIKELGMLPLGMETLVKPIHYYTYKGNEISRRSDLGLYGYSIEAGEKVFVSSGKEFKFKLVSQVSTKGDVLREFGMVGSKELIAFGMDRQMFIVNQKVWEAMGIDDPEGGTFIGYEKDGRFIAEWRIHSSLDMQYEDLGSIQVYPEDPASPFLKQVVEALWQDLKEGGKLRNKVRLDYVPDPNSKEFHWFRLNVLTPDGQVAGTSYQAYEGGTRRIIISNYVLEDGMVKKTGWFIDYEVERNSGANKLAGLSLRFDVEDYLKTKAFTPVSVAPYITPEDSIVFDLHDGIPPILEKRNNPNLYLMERWHFNITGRPVNANGREFDLSSPENLNDIIDFAQRNIKVIYDRDEKVVDVDAGGILKVDSKEKFLFDYEDIIRRLNELNKKLGKAIFGDADIKKLKETLDKYKPVALKIYGIPAFTETFISGFHNGDSVGSVSAIQAIEAFGGKQTIIFKNKSIVYDETNTKLLGFDEKEVYSDFRGNRFIIKDNGDSVTYVYKFDKYSKGFISIRTVKVNGEIVIDSVSVYRGKEELTRQSAFLKFEGRIVARSEAGELIALGADFSKNYEALHAAHLTAAVMNAGDRKWSGLQNLLIEFKDGKGIARIRLAGPDIYLGDLMYGEMDLESWSNSQELNELANHMTEIAFLQNRPENAEEVYVSLVASRIPYEAWSHNVKRDSEGNVILDEELYKSERTNSLLNWLYGARFLDHTHNPRFIKGSILLEYDVVNNRPGYANGRKVTTLSGRSVREVVPYTLVKVMLGILGNSTRGEVTIHYDSLGMPVEAKLPDGIVVETWNKEDLGVWFYPHSKGGIGTLMCKDAQRALGRPNQFDRLETNLRNGYIE
ncbi:MAG: hypothetical protein WC330_05560, partial [Candidatus Omnitrophota bacterium]